VMAMIATTGAFTATAGPDVAHFAGSLFFGVGFVFLIVGRGELFTENFLVPVGSLLAGRTGGRGLLRLWSITFLANYAGIVLFALMLSATGVLKTTTLDATGPIADTLVGRGWSAAILSAIVAGAVMTLLTWLAHAAESESARIMVALVIGFVIAVPTLNHAVVSFGELMLAVFAGTTDATAGEIIRTLACAVVGNAAGGFGLVTLNRLIMARGEPDD
jgi:formate/nitrite transporter FocA (FNT family)